MKKGIIGRKIGMTQIFDEKGNVIPVTVIEAGPCVVAQVKTVETDGYDAIQLGFGEIKDNTEDQWDMDLCIIEDQVQWDQLQHQVEYLKVKDFQDIWEELQLQFKT